MSLKKNLGLAVLAMSLLLSGSPSVFAAEKKNQESSKSSSKQSKKNKASDTESNQKNETPANSKGVFWEVKIGKQTAHLFGSIHLGKKDFYPLPNAVEKAFEGADVLMVEVDTSNPEAQAKAMPYLTYAAPDKLQNNVKPETWEKITQTLGPAADQIQALRPATLCTVLSIGIFTRQGYEPSYGIDAYFTKRAKDDKKTIVELESIEFQAQLLGSLGQDEGDDMISQTLEGLKNGEIQKMTSEMVDAWRKGNVDALTKIVYESSQRDAGNRKIMKVLLDDRNVGMVEKIVQSMNEGKKLFIVVGAGHMAGKNSIIDLLEKQGAKVKYLN